MKFYILVDADGSPRGCETSLRKAKQAVLQHMKQEYGEYYLRIEQVEVPVNADTVRRLLGDLNGYAKDRKMVWQYVG